ncbi:hypothetical protein Tco_1470724, partial [Tanacetum coccineum]
LKAQSQAKDNVIVKLKEQIKSLKGNGEDSSVKMDMDEIETLNIELEHRVTKLIAENEHLKQTYKQLYDLIKPSRVRAKEQTESLVNQLNQKKFKGKDIVDNASQVSNTIALEIYKLDPVILAPKVKNNREAHEYYLKLTMEQVAILRELIQELLGYFRDTCPDIHKPSKKLVAVTPIYKKKTVQFTDAVTSSGNIPKVTNRPVLSSTGVNPSTSASGSKPSGAKALCSICNERLFDANHAISLIDHVNSMNMRAKSVYKKNKRRKEWRPTGKVLTATKKVPLRVPIPLEVVAPKYVVTRVYIRRPKVPKSVQNSEPKVVQIVLRYLDSVCSKHMTRDRSQINNFVHKFLGTVKFSNDQVEKIMGYGDY